MAGMLLVLAVVVATLLLLVRMRMVLLLPLLYFEGVIRLPFLPDFFPLVLQLVLALVSVAMIKKLLQLYY